MQVQQTWQTTSRPAAVSNTAKTRAARIIRALILLFMAFDLAVKFIRPRGVVEMNAKMGYHEGLIVPLAVVLLVCTVLYAIPRTAILGAVLLTGYLGGATATHVRVGDPFFFPVVFGVLIWASLYLADERLRALIPLRK